MTDELKKLLGTDITAQVEKLLGEANDLFFHKKTETPVISNNGEWIPKAKLDENLTVIKDLKTQIATFTTEVESLKKSGKNSEELNTKITELQTKLSDTEKQNALTVKKFALREALQLNGAKHPDLLEGKFDLTKIELDDKGAIKDVENLIKPVKESYKDLFGEVKRAGFAPKAGSTETATDFYTKEEIAAMKPSDMMDEKILTKVNKSLEYINSAQQ